MRLKNYTDIPNERIREIIRFVRPNGISNFDVKITNTKRGYSGIAYRRSSWHDRSNPFINGRLTRNSHEFPYYRHYDSSKIEKTRLNLKTGQRESYSYSAGTGGYIPHLVLSREEALVDVTAHELRHLKQMKGKCRRRVWGARGQFSERDADAYAIRKIREWRRLKFANSDALELSVHLWNQFAHSSDPERVCPIASKGDKYD